MKETMTISLPAWIKKRLDKALSKNSSIVAALYWQQLHFSI